MKAERWKEVERVFEEANARPAASRGAFLDERCGRDQSLRSEVESLLAAHARAGDSLDRPSLFFDRSFGTLEGGLAAGEQIGRYRIIKEIGRGGMGAVYLAERADAQFKKHVAIKFIRRGLTSDAMRRRFGTERQILAAFDHPNIARLFDADTTADGSSYFVMEYLDGLQIDDFCRGHSLSINERLKLFREVCAAVAYAHRHGVIHRDIKPSNIVVTREGVPKLLDFGIAKLLQAIEGAELSLTITGERSMTPEYASPEQVRGEPVTVASDIYSLGVVLYRLLTGCSPYRLTSAALRDVERAITDTEPMRPSIVASRNNQLSANSNQQSLKGDLDHILLKALRKEPRRRYQTVEQFSEDIRRHLEGFPVSARKDSLAYRGGRFMRRHAMLGSAASVCLLLLLLVGWLGRDQYFKPAPPAKSIAVLPFDYLGEDKGSAYLAEGLQEEILTRLAGIAELKVISRTSTAKYKSRPEDLKKVAAQLGVATVLEGSAQKIGDQLRVNVQFIDAQTDSHLWADTYDRKLTDIFAVEKEIAVKIAETLQAKLTGMESSAMAARPTEDAEAHDLYLRARHLIGRRIYEDGIKAIDLYQQAIARDRNYSVAYAGLAEAYAILPAYTRTRSGEGLPKGKAAAERALAINPNLPEAHTALGVVALASSWDLKQARHEFERATALNSNFAEGYFYLSLVLCASGEFDAAIAAATRAVELDPVSTLRRGRLGNCYRLARRFPEAIDILRKAVELDPLNGQAQDALGLAIEGSGRLDEAIAQFQKSFQTSGGDFHTLAFLSHLYGVRGERGKAQETFSRLKELQQESHAEWAYGYALVFLGLDEKEQAIDWLERSYSAKEVFAGLLYIKTDPILDPLRGNARFEVLQRRIVGEKVEDASARER